MIHYADTDQLKVAYQEQGENGSPVILLVHGWPDDASTWNNVMPMLTAAGYRVIAPWLRGFGKTSFKKETTLRTGNSGILAYDAIELMNNLGIDAFNVIGHDWGSTTAEALAIGWPGRIKKVAFISSLPKMGGLPTPPYHHAQLEWYHWFMATKRGAEAVHKDPIGFAHIMWENWAPKGWFNESEFDEVAKSWKNPDFVEVTLHSYRQRWDEAEPDKKSAALEEKIRATKHLALSALYIQGEVDGVNPPGTSEKIHEKFTGPFKRIVMPGVGHFPSREAPAALAAHLLDFMQP